MTKKRTVVPKFGSAAKPGINRNAPVPVKGTAPVVRVQQSSTPPKMGARGK